MKTKNPTVAALLGLLLGPVAYVYVWKLGRGVIVFILNFALFSFLFGDAQEYTPETFAVSLAVSILVSYDCWRIAKQSSKYAVKKEVIEAPKPEAAVVDLRCKKCGIGFAVKVASCPQCGAQQG